MDLPPTHDSPGASSPGLSRASARLERLRAARRRVCADQAAEAREVAALVEDCRAEVRDRVLALGDSDLDIDAQEFADRMCVDTVMCGLGVSKNEATRLVNLADRLAALPEVWDAWSAGVLDGSRVRVLAGATEVLDDVTARAVARDLLPVAGDGPWQGPAPRQWRTRVEEAVIKADTRAAERRRAAAVAARRVRSWDEGDGAGILQLHAGAADIALADQVITDLAHAWPATDEAGVRLSMDQRRADALIGLFRAVRDGSLSGQSDSTAGASGGSAFGDGATAPGVAPGTRLPRVPVRRVHDLGLVLHADTLFNDGPAADAAGQLRGLGQPAVLAPGSARTLARRQLDQGTGVQVLVVDDTGALERVVRLDGEIAEACGTRESLIIAVREQLAEAPALDADGHDPTVAIARHVRAEAPTCSFYDCPRRARSCDLDHDTPWPRGPTSVTNLDPKCRRHHNAKTLGVVRTRLIAGPGAGQRSVRWTLPTGIQVTTTPQSLPGVPMRPQPTAPTAG
jgi:hypothetical protein